MVELSSRDVVLHDIVHDELMEQNIPSFTHRVLANMKPFPQPSSVLILQRDFYEAANIDDIKAR